MDFLGGIVQGIILFILILIVGYILFTNPGWVLIGVGMSILIFMALRSVVHNHTQQNSPWE